MEHLPPLARNTWPARIVKSVGIDPLDLTRLQAMAERRKWSLGAVVRHAILVYLDHLDGEGVHFSCTQFKAEREVTLKDTGGK